jgi:superfamily II DNA/RNA helicase
MVESSKKTETEVIETHGILSKDRTKNNAFINYGKEWDNEEHFKIPPHILKGIYEGINFKNPSKIQAVAIPMIQKQDKDGFYENLVAQSKNGSGKTGAYAIGTLLRIDPTIKKA